MPHGAGSAGGGGGYHGGGYHGGYHGHHGGRGQCSPLGWFIAILSTFVVGVILSLSLGLSLGTEVHRLGANTEQYGLTDNFIIPFKGDFCQTLQPTSRNLPNAFESTATLYFLSKRPPLINREVFMLSDEADFDSSTNYHSWNFVLNDGSKTSFQVCYEGAVVTHYDIVFYLIKGVDNLNKWIENTEAKHAVQSFRLTSHCMNYTYKVSGDANYYFVFFLDSIRPTSLNVTFNFNRTLYSIPSDLVVKTCSFPLDGSSSCSLSAPTISSGYTALLSLNTTPPVNYNDGAKIYFNCQPRGWLYAVIVIVVVFVSVYAVATFVFVSVKVVLSLLKSSSKTSTTTVTTATAVPFSKDDNETVKLGSVNLGGGHNYSDLPPPYR